MKKSFLNLAALVTVAALVLSACAPAATSAPQPTEAASGMDALVAAAKAEGTLNVIALPRDWCNYGAMIDGFKAKYGLAVNEINPDAGSADELAAIDANKDNKGPQAPDVIDVGYAFGPQAKAAGQITPYKVSTWDSIPADLKDADGYWYVDYYGVMSFVVNKDLVANVPQDWADLLKPEYKGQVALAGDPRASNQAILSVYASALGNGGSLDNAQPGLDFFKKLNDAGNFVPVIAKAGTLAQGETAIYMAWNYNGAATRDTLNGNPPVEVVIPKTGALAGVYVQAISAYAPHPNAAKLWMEYLYSDEGHIHWMNGYCIPARFNDMVSRNAVPADVLAKLPSAELLAQAQFPTLAQQDAAKKLITENWDATVGADVK